MTDFLIIARSGRALAASAKRAGYCVHVIDCFADEDTRSLSESVRQLQYHCDGFAEEQLLEYARDIISRHANITVVVGSGFEANPDLFDKLSELAPVISNRKNTVVSLKEPASFCEILSKAAIRHPGISLLRPIDSNKWLIKKVAGIGGEHVQRLDQVSSDSESDFYYQEYISGVTSSVVFLANGSHANIVGFNQQLQTDQFSDMPFLYQGAVSVNVTTDQHKHVIEELINKITDKTRLTGLCGLDYIIDEKDEIVVLEINPRPPSTFELHESEQSLFDAHLACFDGRLLDYTCHSEGDNNEKSRGYAILYAKENLQICDNIDWPLWVKDRPSSGRVIPVKFPVCSVHGRENSIDKLKAVLFNRLDQIESFIVSMQNAA
ncbi:MAG: ATP-grasp domain-containing protein [Proteobacteria bacterium]|nr:ATP-grasp domain-containing protein [Pseudomonadota bacterium]